MIVVGLSHRTAPLAIRERLAIAAGELEAVLERLRSEAGVAETVVLSTCNRVEIFAAAQDGVDDASLRETLTRCLAQLGGREVVAHLRSFEGRDAIRHLFRIASSLDSLVVGEPQILGQLKDAIRIAVEAKAIGPELSSAMRSALSVAKRVRTETAIGTGQVSVPSVAVDLARRIFDDLHGHTALLVGAGEMAESAARLLARSGVGLVVVNRSLERAQELATAVGGRPRSWGDLDASLVEADIVVTSTSSPSFVITRRQLHGLRKQRRGRSLFLIDIAVPRDVEPAVNELENVYLYDIDDLSNVVADSLDGRASEAERAEAIVEREAESFEERRSQLSMKPLIVALRERTRQVLANELERTCRSKLKHLTEEDKRALVTMLEAAVNKLMHSPSTRLRQLAPSPQSEDVMQMLIHLFDLEQALELAAQSEATQLADDEAEEEVISERRPIAAR